MNYVDIFLFTVLFLLVEFSTCTCRSRESSTALLKATDRLASTVWPGTTAFSTGEPHRAAAIFTAGARQRPTEVWRPRIPTESVGRSGPMGSRLLSHPYSHRKRPVARQRRGERPPREPGGQHHVRQVQVLPSAARRAASLVALPRVGPQAGYAIHRGGGRFRWCWALTWIGHFGCGCRL